MNVSSPSSSNFGWCLMLFDVEHAFHDEVEKTILFFRFLFHSEEGA